MSTPRSDDVDSQRAHRLLHRLGFDEVEAGAWLHFQDVAILLHDLVGRELVRHHRLTLTDVQMLAYLKRHGPSTMGALAETLMVTPGALTQQAKRLERRRLVQRRAGSDDGRTVIAVLTLHGARSLTAALETYARLVRTHFLAELSRQQMIALGDSCRRINTRLTGLDSAPDPSG